MESESLLPGKRCCTEENGMKLFIVFDAAIQVEGLAPFGQAGRTKEVTLCPLTNDISTLDKVKDALARKDVSIRLLNTAEVVGKRVEFLRERICGWSANIGKQEVRSRSVRDWFLLPGLDVSAWWFSLLSEKNTLKTECFFRIAQVHTVREFLAAQRYDLCVIAVSDRNSRKAIRAVASALGIRTRMLSSPGTGGLKSKLKSILARSGVAGMLFLGFIHLGRKVNDGRLARRHLGHLTQRKPDPGSLLFVSYFPAIDKEAARDGIFKNKFALPLHEELITKKVPLVWLLMAVPFDGYDFNGAVRLASTFAEKGEKLFIIEEFLTIGDALRSLLLWLRQVWVSLFLFHSLKRACLLSEPVGQSCEPFIKDLWRLSFCGPIGMEGILYAFIFKKIFSEIPQISDCLYLCEMLAWEKALNAAKNKICPGVRTIGFQHSSVSKNDLSYFYDKSETIRTGKISDMPLPDLLACNGEHIYSLLSKCGYPGLMQVEAVRYLYLEKILSLPPLPRKGRPVLLIAGPYRKEEAKALFSLVYAAFPKADLFDIWFKGHPSMPVEDIFKELAIDISGTGYVIHHNNISEYFPNAWAVLVSTSTVSMEALAFGCEVIIPVLADVMLINPLTDFEKYYHKVTCSEELRKAMENIAAGNTLYDINEYRQFVRKYWNLDATLSKWSALLKL